MLVTLIADNKIYRMTLSENHEGNYWMKVYSGNEETNLLNIKGKNGEWIIRSTKYSSVINEKCIKISEDNISAVASNNNILSEEVLKEYSKYYISPQYSDDIYILYCTPTYEKNVLSYVVKNDDEISIGRNIENDIKIDDNLVNDYHASIFKKNGRWFIENYDNKSQVFINSNVVDDEAEVIENGDIVLICGIRIMILGDVINIFGDTSRVKVSGKTLMRKAYENEIPEIDPDMDNTEEAVELYKENDYFYNSPRIKDKIDSIKVTIDQPPDKEGKGSSGILQFLSTFTTMAMGSVAFLTLINAIASMQNSTQSKMQVVTRLVSSGVMLVSMLLIPVLRMIIQKRINKKNEQKRQIAYKKYINSKILQINKIMERQGNILRETNMSAEQCERVILEKSNELWERKKNDSDFLCVNIGTGNMPLDLGINRQEPKFSLVQDNLMDVYYEVTNNSRVLEDIPITLSLTENNISSIIGDSDKLLKSYMENIVLQLVTLHNYRDLKLVFLVRDESNWEYAKVLPHVWDDTNEIRFFGSNNSDIKQISQYLEEIFNERNGDGDTSNIIQITKKEKDYRQFDSYYLIITDDYKNMKNVRIINRVLGNSDNLGFGLLCVTKDITQLPNECKSFIEIRENGKCLMYGNEVSMETKRKFLLDKFDKFDYSKISKVISNIPIKYTSSKATSLPEHYNFLEMYNSGNIEQLNILDRWRNNDSTISLQAKIGIDATGAPIYLDAHEKYHGPHGLIAGTTGSGKSEFIITYILSLAINYHPDDVTFVLVDYKGGGLAGAFKKKNIQLPHLVGTITNIDSVRTTKILRFNSK